MRSHTAAITAIFILCFSGSVWAQPQPRDVTDKFYPDPPVTFTTPTLSLDEDRFATYDEILDWLNELGMDPCMQVSFIGTTTLGRKVPLITFSSGKDPKKVKVWLQGAIHGNEPAGSEALFALMQYLLKDSDGRKLLDRMEIAILPVANIDGYLSDQRVSGDGFDLNRDQTKFADPQSVLIKRAFIEWNPDVAADFHEFKPIRAETANMGTDGGAIFYDVLFLPTRHPNVPKILQEASDAYFRRPAEKTLDEAGYTHFTYFTIGERAGEMALTLGARSPQSSSTSYALSNAISFFVEIRGIGFGRHSLVRRTNSAFIIQKTMLRQVYDHQVAIKKIVSSAIRETVGAKEPVVVQFHSNPSRIPVTFLDLTRNETIDYPAMLAYDAADFTVDLVRRRPKAYVIEPSETRAIENLRTFGVKMTVLKRPKTLRVESYSVSFCEEADKSWEKIRKLDVLTETFAQKIRFEKGTVIVKAAQENANFVVSVLEPEAENGFVAFRVIEASRGAVLPVHRFF